ncbi:MAG: hypothetical protein Q8891_06770 [Bacteroidota bacterium]|nr:hypothetical protein [Bacteroidota bacterium]
MKFTKKILILIGALMVILIITNPSYSSFKNYTKDFALLNVHTNTRTAFNGFIFSVYLEDIAKVGEDNNIHITTVKYLGILSNFFELSRSRKNVKDLYIKW